MIQKLKIAIIALIVAGFSASASVALANLQIQPGQVQYTCKKSQNQDLLCAITPEACEPQSCGTITVNTSLTTCDCNIAAGSCGLDGAIRLANKCTTPSTITFDSSLASQTIDLTGLSTPISITGKDITVDGGASRMAVQPKDGQAALLVKGQNNLIKNLLFKGATVPPIHIDTTAVNADVRNVATYETGVALLQSEAADSSDSNVPVMVLPGASATEFVVFAILPTDGQADADKLRFCRTSSQNTNDCLDLEVTGTSFLPDPLKDPVGTSTDSSKVILEITVSIPDASKNYMAFVKNFGKSVAVAQLKAGLSPFYVDSDKDLLRDIDETTYFMTDATKSDTDSDGLGDFYNMIGQPGQPIAQNPGAQVYPAANTNGYLPGNYKMATDSSSSPTANPARAGGCSAMADAGNPSLCSCMISIMALISVMVLLWKRSRVS